MANVLNDEKKQRILALGRLASSLWRIQQATGVRRETAGIYLKAVGIAVRPSGAWGRRSALSAAAQVTATSTSAAPPLTGERMSEMGSSNSALEGVTDSRRQNRPTR
jgi:hypothetical protein